MRGPQKLYRDRGQFGRLAVKVWAKGVGVKIKGGRADLGGAPPATATNGPDLEGG